MELAAQLGGHKATLGLDWVQRLENEEADALTNEEFEAFNEGNRVQVDFDKLPYKVLPQLVAKSEGYHKEIEERKEEAKKRGEEASKAMGKKKRKKWDLRLRDLW